MDKKEEIRLFDRYVTFLLCFNLIEEDKKGKIEAVHELLNEIAQEETL